MKKIDDGTYEIDLLDIVAMIIGTAMIIFGFIGESVTFFVGLALFSLVIWGNKTLKVISIMLSIIFFTTTSIVVQLIGTFDILRIAFGVEVFLTNYVALWPIVISATISIFSMFYAWKEQEVYLKISTGIFIGSSAILTLYNTLKVVDSAAVTDYIVFAMINFSIYMFAYLLCYSVFYLLTLICKKTAHQILLILENSESPGKDRLKNSGKKENPGNVFNKMLDRETSDQIEEQSESKKSELELLKTKSHIKKESQQVTKMMKVFRNIILMVIGFFGTWIFSVIYTDYLDASPDLSDLHYLEYGSATVIGFLVSAGLILAGLLSLLSLKTKMRFNVMPIVFNAASIGILVIVSIWLAKTGDHRIIPYGMAIMTFSISMIAIIIDSIVKHKKGHNSEYDQFRQVVLPFISGIMMLVIIVFVLFLFFDFLQAESLQAQFLSMAVLYWLGTTGLSLICCSFMKIRNHRVSVFSIFLVFKSAFDLMISIIIWLIIPHGGLDTSNGYIAAYLISVGIIVVIIACFMLINTYVHKENDSQTILYSELDEIELLYGMDPVRSGSYISSQPAVGQDLQTENSNPKALRERSSLAGEKFENEYMF